MAQIQGFAKNVFFEQLKKFVMIVTGIVYTYIIARYLGPADYGLVTYFIVFTGIINLFGAKVFRTLISVFMPKAKSKQLFWWLVKWQYAVIIPVIAGMFFFAEPITVFLGKESFALLQAAAVLMFFMPLYMNLLALFQSMKMFGKILKIESLMQTGTLAFALLFVIVLQQGPFGVIYAQLAAVLLCIALSLYYLKETRFLEKRFLRNEFEKSEIKRYGKFSYIGSVIGSAYSSFFDIAIGVFVGVVGLGYYYLAIKIGGTFIGKTTSTLYDVLTPYSIEKHKEKETLGRFVSLGIKLNIVLTAVLGILLVVVSKPLLDIFMPEYSAGFIIIPLYVVYRIITSFEVLGQILMSLNKAEYLVAAKIVMIVVSVPTAVYLISTFTWIGIIYARIIQSIVENTVIFYFVRKEGVRIDLVPRKSDWNFFREKLGEVKEIVPFVGKKL